MHLIKGGRQNEDPIMKAIRDINPYPQEELERGLSRRNARKLLRKILSMPQLHALQREHED